MFAQFLSVDPSHRTAGPHAAGARSIRRCTAPITLLDLFERGRSPMWRHEDRARVGAPFPQ